MNICPNFTYFYNAGSTRNINYGDGGWTDVCLIESEFLCFVLWENGNLHGVSLGIRNSINKHWGRSRFQILNNELEMDINYHSCHPIAVDFAMDSQ